MSVATPLCLIGSGVLNITRGIKRALDGGAYSQTSWSGTLNVGSVDLIAMVVSDAGLASTEPQWWNASPLGCLLLGSQPRGGWQVMQRAAQWGNDYAARCFGVDCKMPEVYCYFACTIRNRLEVWQSDRFDSPMLELRQESIDKGVLTEVQSVALASTQSRPAGHSPSDREKGLTSVTQISLAVTKTEVQKSRTQASTTSRHLSFSVPFLRRTSSSRTEPENKAAQQWLALDRGVRGSFAVKRPTKLVDGSRGGQAFMCSIFIPKEGVVYSVEEQARLQLLSVILVVAGLARTDDPIEFEAIMKADFGLDSKLGNVFHVLLPALVIANILIIGLSLSVFNALWRNNIYGNVIPYILQLCAVLSWASGATGLLMLGGNPRIRNEKRNDGLEVVQQTLDNVSSRYIELYFGSLHGSGYQRDRGKCTVPTGVVRDICKWNFRLVRTWQWWLGMIWFGMFLLLSITLLITGSKVAVVGSQIMSITLLVLTSMLRGAGLSGPEEWMIPSWKRRAGAKPAVQLQGRRKSRAGASAT